MCAMDNGRLRASEKGQGSARTPRLTSRSFYSSSRVGVSDGPELKTLLSSGYQIGGAIPSVGGEIYVEWNQLVRD
jgi:hypothetical protein